MNRIPLAMIRDIAAALAEYRDDEEAYLDTLDGETDAVDIIDHLIEQSQHATAMVVAIKAREDALKARRERIAARAEAAKDALQEVLEAIDLRKVERPSATVSRRAGSVSVVIENEDEIPSQMMTVKTTSAPDKKAIRQHLEAGETVPGARLRRAPETVTIRSQ